MSYFPKLLLVIGAVLAFIGSFMPWWVGGDLISYQSIGLVIRLDPFFRLNDNGGLSITLLSIISLLFTLSSPFRHQKVAIVISALCLVAAVVYQWIDLAIANSAGYIGAPEPLIGLEVIALSAIVVLIAAVWNYRNRSETVEL